MTFSFKVVSTLRYEGTQNLQRAKSDAHTLPMNSRIFSDMMSKCWLDSGRRSSYSEALLLMMSSSSPYGPSRRRRIVSMPRLSMPPETSGTRLPKMVARSVAARFFGRPVSLDLRPQTSSLPPSSKSSEYKWPLSSLESMIPTGMAWISFKTLRASLDLDKPKPPVNYNINSKFYCT